MADTFNIEIATPERLLAHEPAIRAQIPAREGYIGVLPDHAPLLSILGVGVLTYTTPENQRHVMAIQGGFLEILDNNVRVLPDLAVKGQEVDVAKAEQELRDAEASLVNPDTAIDIASALNAVSHARARIDAANKLKNGEE